MSTEESKMFKSIVANIERIAKSLEELVEFKRGS